MRSRRAANPSEFLAASFLETAIVIDASRDAIASRRFDEVVAKSKLSIEPVTAEQAAIARAAYRDFGKGQRPSRPAQFWPLLRLCAGEATDEPLLFKGEDFGFTDIRSHR